jgi:YebC/PmpR family DNA-binding regulatory protein
VLVAIEYRPLVSLLASHSLGELLFGNSHVSIGNCTESVRMAGHSKWSKVKRFKGAIDAKRGKIFSKLSKEITIAAKTGGGDPNGNPRLRSAIQAARAQSMPSDNIERAIKRGTGEDRDGEQFAEIVYEGYAPGGVAIIVETATDNKNRTGAEIRRIFTQNNGNLASSGSVSYMFHRKGQITVPRSSIDEERLLEIALEAGAEELTIEEDQYVITTSHDQLYAVAEALKKAGVTTDGQKFTFIPDTTVAVRDEAVARQVLRLCEALEEDDDVQNVYSNLDIPDELLARLPA